MDAQSVRRYPYSCKKRSIEGDTESSEFDFLTRRPCVAWLTAPAVIGDLEGAVILVPEERPGLVAPVAANDVRIPELGVSPEDCCGDLFLIGDQIVAAKYFPCCCSNYLSGQRVLRLVVRWR